MLLQLEHEEEERARAAAELAAASAARKGAEAFRKNLAIFLLADSLGSSCE